MSNLFNYEGKQSRLSALQIDFWCRVARHFIKYGHSLSATIIIRSPSRSVSRFGESKYSLSAYQKDFGPSRSVRRLQAYSSIFVDYREFLAQTTANDGLIH